MTFNMSFQAAARDAQKNNIKKNIIEKYDI